jgi:glucoamylase
MLHCQPGVLVTLIPEGAHPSYNIYWLRDACLGYIAWLAELELEPNATLRALVDDSVHALIRTQSVASIAGNIFTGGLEEALFDLHIAQITDNNLRIGSPAAGV